MTALIFLDYIKWFDGLMGGRKVLLLIDSAPGHTGGMLTILERASLLNTRVEFLPKNVTSLYQPLDQGIIRTFKAYYRRYWLSYMVDQVEQDRNPLKTMNVLRAVQWAVAAWHEISPQTVMNCFTHSTIFGPREGPQGTPSGYSEPQLEAELEVYLQQLSQAGQIRQLIPISNFININGEDALTEPEASISQEAIEASIVALYDAPDDEESDEEVEPQVIKLDEALDALERLKLYEGQQEDGNETLITALIKAERVIRGRRAARVRQTTITSFFK